ncbi:MAG: PQQ-dependent sugar dehydrogenase [Bacteroidia bacterium]|nr:PQQ-dependent sugar dehydrogenase [Bacteroidia bacterium]
MKLLLVLVFSFICHALHAQHFVRRELTAELEIPWEIQCSNDGNLWISESQGRIVKVNPTTGIGKQIFKAKDYSDAHPSEKSTLCHKPSPGSGCLGLALHPDFNVDSPYVFRLYSYLKNPLGTPQTKFKIVKIELNKNRDSAIAVWDLVLDLPTGFDHLGGRILAIKEKGNYYLFVSTGDNGTADDGCYSNPALNPNNLTQDPNTLNGKILRYHINGSIPSDNPIAGNPFYTRGHRNPQGLIYNAQFQLLYNVEHGDKTDDEVNLLQKGMNYGWKSVRGYHNDNNRAGEAEAVSQYTPNPNIAGDQLVEPMYAWCHSAQPISSFYLDWCTPAPSDGVLYSGNSMPFLNNCLLITTLKDGANTNQEVQCIRLSSNGKSVAEISNSRPNVFTLFSEDGIANGRLRDIAISPDGSTIYLINNGGIGSGRDKIIEYKYAPKNVLVYPNPVEDELYVDATDSIENINIFDLNGNQINTNYVPNSHSIDVSNAANGFYVAQVKMQSGELFRVKFIKK